MRELALLDKQWRSQGKYGKVIVDQVETLISNKPIGMTEVYISPSMYQFKFGTKIKAKEQN